VSSHNIKTSKMLPKFCDCIFAEESSSPNLTKIQLRTWFSHWHFHRHLVCVYVCHLESPSCLLGEWWVTRSFERHDSITISVTRENSSPSLFSSFYSRSLFHVKPRKTTNTLYYTRSKCLSIRIFHYQAGIKALSLLSLDGLTFLSCKLIVIYDYCFILV